MLERRSQNLEANGLESIEQLSFFRSLCSMKHDPSTGGVELVQHVSVTRLEVGHAIDEARQRVVIEVRAIVFERCLNDGTNALVTTCELSVSIPWIPPAILWI